ncbi:mitochondrial carrier domain-containing protein [Zychaea mexicana]|uniref:mitochondrial carrier domain-containing protein n=1 Tax=Zychaea mexicana TaxID=64656 RepID=UPI0022FF0CC8|nr:mitochondrial carrier domain-containing protein [Zychaea mexicana]KAI9495984.1 mitochondrial carrier domain-containing protein [Zychaea mexicana]
MSKNNDAKKTPILTHLVAGGSAGFMEACTCHPLDTIKVRMQLAKNAQKSASGKKLGFFGVGVRIVKNESFLALYKGLGAVIAGIVPKMAIRFSSFELYKGMMVDENGKNSRTSVFFAGLAAGTTEAVMVVSPMDLIKIRLQAQRNSMADPMDIPKYRNAPHAAYVIIKEEGFRAMYKGVALTALRQATNQAANFTAYQELKKWGKHYQNIDGELPAYQTLVIGGISGAMGPLSNAPIDTIKTRIQKSHISGGTAWSRFVTVTTEIYKKEGVRAFYKGLTPRVLRVAPGQSVTFVVYERVKSWLEIVQGKVQEGELTIKAPQK